MADGSCIAQPGGWVGYRMGELTPVPVGDYRILGYTDFSICPNCKTASSNQATQIVACLQHSVSQAPARCRAEQTKERIMFKIIGGVVVYGFALFGFGTCLLHISDMAEAAKS